MTCLTSPFRRDERGPVEDWEVQYRTNRKPISPNDVFGLLFRLCSLVMLVAGSCGPSSALAQSSHLDAATIQYQDLSDSELGRAQWKRTRARIGVSFSVLALPMSAGLLAAGVIFAFSDRDAEDDVSNIGDPRKAKIFLTTGSVVLAGGLAGLGVSAHGLRSAKRELRQLEGPPPTTTLRFGPTGVTLRHRF